MTRHLLTQSGRITSLTSSLIVEHLSINRCPYIYIWPSLVSHLVNPNDWTAVTQQTVLTHSDTVSPLFEVAIPSFAAFSRSYANYSVCLLALSLRLSRS